MVGIDVSKKLFDLIIRGVNDHGNALGEDSLVGKLGAFGDLIPLALSLIGDVRKLPSEVRDLDVKEVGELITHVAEKIDLPGDQAEVVVRTGAEAANNILQTVANEVRKVGVVVRQQKENAAPAAE